MATKIRERNSFHAAVAGGIAGGLDLLMTYPFEFVKTQMQLDAKHTQKYKGVMDCFRQTVKTHGFHGLYRGWSVLFFGAVPKAAIRFGTYEFVKNRLQTEDGSLSLTNSFLAGLASGISESVLAVTPMETIKIRIINDMRQPCPKYKGLVHGVTSIIKKEGISGLYRGLSATVFRQGSNQAIRFFMMCSQRDVYMAGDHNSKLPLPVVGLFGMIAGAASVVGNIPVDVVKTRMQGKLNGNFISSVKKIYHEEGSKGFFKGTITRMSRVCMDVAITFMIYEVLMAEFDKWWL